MLNNFERGLLAGLSLGAPIGAISTYILIAYLNHKKNEYLRKTDTNTQHLQHLQQAMNALAD